MLPTVGRVVHYQSYGTPGGEYLPEPRAAIVTAVRENVEFVDLAVLNPTGMFFNLSVERADEPTPGHWNWPPRLPADPRPEVPSSTAVDGL